MHERHAGCAEDLRPGKKGIGLSAVGGAKQQRDELADDPAHAKAENDGNHKAVNDLDPFGAVDARKAAVQGDGGAGQACDQGVAFAGRDAEHPCQHRPEHDGKKRGGEGDDRLMGIVSEIDHLCDRFRATVAFNILIRNTPRKLKAAAIRIAARADIQRVTTQVAMAFGASVQPFTKITPMVRSTARNKSGLDDTCSQKY